MLCRFFEFLLRLISRTTGCLGVEIYFVLGLVARVVRWRVSSPCSCFSFLCRGLHW
jgi:hypothetical protein